MLTKIQNLTNKVLAENKIFWPFLTILFIICRMPTWFYPFNSDHWIFYYVGRIFSEGGLLYVNAWDHKPPLIFVFNGLMHLLFGGNIILHRIFLTLLTFLDIYLFYKLLSYFVKKINPENALKLTRIGLILYVFWRNLSQFTSSGNNTENFGLIFVLLMLLSFLKFQKNKKWIYLFLSGVSLSILFFLKSNFILLCLPIVVELLIENYKTIKKLVLNCFVFGLPLVLHASFWIFYFYKNNALYDFFLASFLFSSKYLKSAWLGRVSPHLVFILILLPLFVPLLIFIYKFLKDYKLGFKDKTWRFLFFLLAGSIILGFGMGSFYPYYFLVLLPGFILIILYPPNIFLELLRLKNSLICGLLILGMLISFGISYKQFYNYFGGKTRQEAQEFKEVAQYIKERTNKDDKIIAYTYGATFYRLTERNSASRFISASILLLDEREGYDFNLSQIFLNEIEKNKPKYVIISQWSDDFYLQNKKIVNYINENFTFDKSFNEFAVLKNKNF